MKYHGYHCITTCFEIQLQIKINSIYKLSDFNFVGQKGLKPKSYISKKETAPNSFLSKIHIDDLIDS